MARPRLNEQEMQVISAEVSQQMSLVILERGLDYYQRGRVSNIQVTEQTIIATVRGSEPYYVVLDKEWFAFGSGCSCPYGTFCKHMAAVFFAVYSDFGNPLSLLREWKDNERHSATTTGAVDKAAVTGKVSALDRAEVVGRSGVAGQAGAPDKAEGAGQAGVDGKPRVAGTRLFAVKPEPVLQMPKEDGSLADWEAYLDQRLTDVVDGRSPYESDWQSRYAKIEGRIGELLDEADFWADEPYFIYTTLLRMIAIRRVLTRANHNGMTERHWYFNDPPLLSLARQLVQSLASGLEVSSETEILQIPPERIRELDLFLRSFMTRELANTTMPVEVFQLIWLHILRHVENPLEQAREWVSDLSSNRLSQGIGQIRTDDTMRDELQIVGMSVNQVRAITLLYILGGEDTIAQRALALSPNLDWAYVLSIPSFLMELSAEERAMDWLRWMESRLASDERTMIHPLSELWLQIGRASEQAAQEALDFLQRHKTRDAYHYKQGLLLFGRYQEWAELQLLGGLFPSDLGKENLRMVEREGLACLLPIYHQAVERMVAQKNRGSYRIAARWLKKLRTYYKKLKRTDEWDRFVLRFKDKHSRLRALQEELVRAGISQ